jgi:hypothetical protein
MGLLTSGLRRSRRLNYLIPDDTPTRSLDVVDYPDNAHASTKPIKEGILEARDS